MTERKGTAVRLPQTLLERLDAECQARVVGRNFIITRAVEHYLDHVLPPLPEGSSDA